MPPAAETSRQLPAETAEQPALIHALVLLAIFGCVALAVSIVIADFVVPDHDWIADTISDLGAGRYEFIVDIGLYAFSAALIGLAVLAAHVHLGAWDWSVGIIALIVFGLLVFLIGARNEYGDNDNEGWVIHTYLVYALGAAMTVACFSLARGSARVSPVYRTVFIAAGIVWSASAPLFFFLPTDIDGIYERFLGAVSFVLVLTLAHLFYQRAKQLKANRCSRM
ncbi:DUF998 domain-containing protein [Salipiger sp. HF18]|uniref:DUF998 domain-containing protein n=1 Tax=Salipiger sp. HF18 TaxID=2721557 RepID=UPI00142E0826|nr:DUF998 domain-containing protein [Salipiger sp. HF18]NIY95638.1 DUF998 domain-containing protein [Salipiger sp. HF18]